MCFLAVLYRVVPGYPVVAGANRDEYRDRGGEPPRHIRSGVFGGVDPRAGGTWLAVTREPALAAVTNLHRDAQPDPDARSRGLLCVDAVEAGLETSADVRKLVSGAKYDPFNLLLASPRRGWIATLAGEALRVRPLDPGLHVIGNLLPDDPDDPKVDRGRRLIGRPDTLDAALGRLAEACCDHGIRRDRADALCVHGERFATLSSSIVALHESDPGRHLYLYAPGNPCRAHRRDVSGLLRSPPAG